MRIWPWIVIPALAAQDLDVVIERKARRSVTVLDQIEDPAERNAFLKIYRESDAAKRRSLSAEFLKTFPASSLLAQIYEASARAYFDLGEYPAALADARKSLELYPENPLLLGNVAAAEANLGQTAVAAADAWRTLELLDQFAHPASMTEKDWKPIRDRLRNAAIQVLGSEAEYGESRRAGAPVSAFSGSAACRSCHSREHTAWQATGMARMLQPIAAERVIGDFDGATYAEAGEPVAKMLRNGPDFLIDLRRRAGNWDRYKIAYTIGSKWQQAYATRAPSGALHVLPVQYNRINGAWINYWKMIDPPHADRSDATLFHGLRPITSYQPNCAPCHTSQVRDSGFAEAGVNCEMCHGPSAAHVKGELPMWRFGQVSNKDYVNVCAQCHAQSALREPQGFPPRYRRRPYAEFSRRAFYKDGRFRETTFIVEAFERSACFQRGKAHCGHCHDVHPSNAASNPKSLKFLDDPDQMCRQCHAASFNSREHTRHDEPSEGARCVSCHMPKIMNSLLFTARTHEIETRPRPAMTLRFGAKESPDACVLCHKEKTATWTADQLRSW